MGKAESGTPRERGVAVGYSNVRSNSAREILYPSSGVRASSYFFFGSGSISLGLNGRLAGKKPGDLVGFCGSGGSPENLLDDREGLAAGDGVLEVPSTWIIMICSLARRARSRRTGN